MKFSDFQKKASKAGLEAVDHGNGHWQLRGGPFIVNYYPFGKRQTIYVCGTNGGKTYKSLDDALAAAKCPPEIVSPYQRDERRGSYKRLKKRLLKKNPFCKWCKVQLAIETATIEHVIPLARGGLDHQNNMTLACQPCNFNRGHDMPEVAGQ